MFCGRTASDKSAKPVNRFLCFFYISEPLFTYRLLELKIYNSCSLEQTSFQIFFFWGNAASVWPTLHSCHSDSTAHYSECFSKLLWLPPPCEVPPSSLISRNSAGFPILLCAAGEAQIGEKKIYRHLLKWPPIAQPHFRLAEAHGRFQNRWLSGWRVGGCALPFLRWKLLAIGTNRSYIPLSWWHSKPCLLCPSLWMSLNYICK